MNDLIRLVENNGKVLGNSREVAENFDKRHTHVLEKIEGLINGIDSAENSAQYFIQHEYKDTSGKVNKEYLLTRDGFSLLVMGFTGKEALAWKLKYIEAFNKMEDTIRNPRPLTPEEQLKLHYEIAQKQEKRIDSIEEKVTSIVNTATLSPAQCDMVVDKYKAKIVYILGGKESAAYKDNSLRGQVFSDFHKSVKEEFGVKYKHIFVKNIEGLLEFIDEWRPKEYLVRSIKSFNSQMRMF